MAIRDLTSERLFVESGLSAGQTVELTEAQARYLTTVLRLRQGAEVLVFNGRDGEWLAALGEVKKRGATLRLERQVRPQEGGPDIDYVFAPLKRSRLDYMVQKVTEMGVRRSAARHHGTNDRGEGQHRTDAGQRRRGGRAMRHSSCP